MMSFAIVVIVFLVVVCPLILAISYSYHRTRIHEMLLKDKASNYQHLIGKK